MAEMTMAFEEQVARFRRENASLQILCAIIATAPESKFAEGPAAYRRRIARQAWAMADEWLVAGESAAHNDREDDGEPE